MCVARLHALLITQRACVCDGKRVVTLDGLRADLFLGQRERERGHGLAFYISNKSEKKFHKWTEKRGRKIQRQNEI